MKTPKSQTPREIIFTALAHHRSRFLGGLSGDADFHLADLAAGVGMLGAQVISNETSLAGAKFNHRPLLEKIAAQTVGWLDQLGEKNPFTLIHDERERQEKLFRAGKFNFTASSKSAGAKRKFRVLLEEIGEVAQECDALEYAKRMDVRASITEKLATELVQVAAVAVAWLESMEGKS
jgi:NTP pyrophosphatase (non-canonical NTP hydrolase)